MEWKNASALRDRHILICYVRIRWWVPAFADGESMSNFRAFLITHAHLDHIMGLVLLAGGIRGVRKSIRASRQTLEDLETIFRPSRIWPNLASWNRDDHNFLYLYDP